ncbi:hypothetical protein EHQ64_11250 [Leptospira sarikeiensis]|uniref:Uncharacterized protein n=1 Tax=Leptospira sarikeiensis TaxID=2484943 RepID=A0A4R9K741_9LEPT|nr:hypothetical protein EHQ64_11250 [Leptospira sarikeiensis]
MTGRIDSLHWFLRPFPYGKSPTKPNGSKRRKVHFLQKQRSAEANNQFFYNTITANEKLKFFIS